MDMQQFQVRGHLQNVSIKFTTPDLINRELAHRIELPTRRAKIVTYNRGDQFRDEAKPRARGTEAALIDFKYSESDVNTSQIAVKSRITDEDLKDEGLPPGVVPPVNLQQDAIENCAYKLELSQEIKLANKIFTSTWLDGAAGGTDLAGAWAAVDSNNTFLAQMEIALKAFVTAGVPLDHVRLMLDYATMSRLKRVDAIRDQLKYTSSQSLDETSLARLIGIEKVVVARAIKSTAKEKKDGSDFTGGMIWEKNAGKGSAFLYYYPPAPGRKTMATLYQPWHQATNGGMRLTKAYRREELSSWDFETQEDIGIHVGSTAAGYLWVDTLLT